MLHFGKIMTSSALLGAGVIAMTVPSFGAVSQGDWKGDGVRSTYAGWSPGDGGATLAARETSGTPTSEHSYGADYVGDVSKTEKPALADLVGAPGYAPGAVGGAAARSRRRATVRLTSCFYKFTKKVSSPASHASGNPFAVAVDRLSPSSLDEGATQAEVTHRGTPASSQTSRAKADYSFAFKWPASMPAGASVVAHLRPAWKGAIALQAVQTSQGASGASAHFYAGSDFYDTTLSQYVNTKAHANITKSITGTHYERDYFSHPAANTDTTFGINLTPGHKYFFYSYSAPRSSVDTNYGAPAEAAIDFGSKYLDTPAGMYQHGSSIKGFASPGTTWTTNKVMLIFRVPGRTVSC